MHSLLLLALPLIASASEQTVSVRGKLLCHGKPEKDVLVKLYDHDAGIDVDDLMAEGRTDADGNFFLKGSESEIFSIDPKLNIYHDCDDGVMPCQRKFSIFIPKQYIDKDTYDAGQMELSATYPDEERDCIH